MNIKSPRINRMYDNDFGVDNKREFNYKYIHFSAPAMCKISEEFTPHETKMLLGLAHAISKNNNIILNLIGKPAESRNEILCALGYTFRSNTPKTILKKLFDKDIIKKVKNEKTFCGYAFYINPYVMYYGGSVEDTTLEAFHDSEWREI